MALLTEATLLPPRIGRADVRAIELEPDTNQEIPSQLPVLGEGTPVSEAQVEFPMSVFPPLPTSLSNTSGSKPIICDSQSLKMREAEPFSRSSDGSLIICTTESEGTIFIADEASKAASELDEDSKSVNDTPDSFFAELSEALNE